MFMVIWGVLQQNQTKWTFDVTRVSFKFFWFSTPSGVMGYRLPLHYCHFWSRDYHVIRRLQLYKKISKWLGSTRARVEGVKNSGPKLLAKVTWLPKFDQKYIVEKWPNFSEQLQKQKFVCKCRKSCANAKNLVQMQPLKCGQSHVNHVTCGAFMHVSCTCLRLLFYLIGY